MIDINEKVAAHEEQIKTLFENQREMKDDIKVIHQLATNVERLADKMDSTCETVDKIDQRLGEIESEPAEAAKHLKRVVMDCVITGILSAILGAVIAYIVK